MTPFPQCNEPATLWQVDNTGRLPSWEGWCFIYAGVNACYWHGFAFPMCNASMKTTIFWHTACLINHYAVPHCNSSVQGTYLMAKGLWREAWIVAIHWSTMCLLHYPEAAGLIEQEIAFQRPKCSGAQVVLCSGTGARLPRRMHCVCFE